MMATTDTAVDVDKDSPSEMSSDLHFQDIPHSLSGGSLNSQGSGNQGHTHTFSNFPDADDSDEEEDKTDLLEGRKKQPSFWTFEYYQMFFDVDTYQVLGRIFGSMVPNPRKNFLQYQIRPNPDLYGPFWICITLVFTTAIAGNLANYFQQAGKDYEWKYDFQKVTFAAAAIFSYWWAVPSLLWCLLWWRGNPAGFTFLELICIYGYSLAIYIPISVLWVVPLAWLQWLLVVVGMVLSGSVLLITIWPAVKDDDKKIGGLTMLAILLLHGLLAVGFVLYFFHVPKPDSSTDIYTTVAPNTTIATQAMQNMIPPEAPQSASHTLVRQPGLPPSQTNLGANANSRPVDNGVQQSGLPPAQTNLGANVKPQPVDNGAQQSGLPPGQLNLGANVNAKPVDKGVPQPGIPPASTKFAPANNLAPGRMLPAPGPTPAPSG